MDAKEIKRQILEKGIKSLLDEAKVPMRTHLEVVKALHASMEAHKQTIAEHENRDALLEQGHQAHQRHIREWDGIVRHLHSLPHIKGDKGERGEIGIAMHGKDGKDGTSPDIKTLVKYVLAQMPEQKKARDGKDAVLNKKELINEIVDFLKREKPLDISHIGNAQSFMKNGIRYKFEELMKGGGAAGGTAVYNEVVSGSGTSWTLAHTPTTNTLRLYVNGQRLTPTVDYTLSGTTVTTVLSWAAGTLIADYSYA